MDSLDKDELMMDMSRISKKKDVFKEIKVEEKWGSLITWVLSMYVYIYIYIYQVLLFVFHVLIVKEHICVGKEVKWSIKKSERSKKSHLLRERKVLEAVYIAKSIKPGFGVYEMVCHSRVILGMSKHIGWAVRL